MTPENFFNPDPGGVLTPARNFDPDPENFFDLDPGGVIPG